MTTNSLQSDAAPRTSRSARTCVGCGLRAEPHDLVRLVVGEGEVAFDLAGGSFGRGAHVHPAVACLERAPRGLARAFRQDLRLDAAGIMERLARACDARISGLLMAARRIRAVTVGADASFEALARAEAAGEPVLLVVAGDAGSVAGCTEVQRAAAAGQAMAWGSKEVLGGLLGAEAVAICTVRHPGIGAELKRTRAVAGAAMTTKHEPRAVGTAPAGLEDRGAGCSRRPEAR